MDVDETGSVTSTSSSLLESDTVENAGDSKEHWLRGDGLKDGLGDREKELRELSGDNDGDVWHAPGPVSRGCENSGRDCDICGEGGSEMQRDCPTVSVREDVDAPGGDTTKTGVLRRDVHGVAVSADGREALKMVCGVQAISSGITSWTCEVMSSRQLPDRSRKTVGQLESSSVSTIFHGESSGTKFATALASDGFSGVLNHGEDATLFGDESGESAGGNKLA